MADTPKKKKSTPRTPFEKIGAAYESEARRQERSGNTEMATKTRKAAAKSMTPANKKALEESAQAAKDKKKTTKKKSTSKKTDAVEAAGAKAKDAVTAAKDRNPISQPASKGDKQGPPSPAGSKDNTGSGTSTQRTPKPSKNDDDGTPFDGDAYAKSEKGKASRKAGMEKGKNKSPLRASEDADARTKSPSGRADRAKLPAGYGNYSNTTTAHSASELTTAARVREVLAEGKNDDDGTPFDGDAYAKSEEGKASRKAGMEKGKNKTPTYQAGDADARSNAARTSRIKELANRNRYNETDDGIRKDPGDDGKMPTPKEPRPKVTVLTDPGDDGKMPTPKENKPGFLSRLRGRMSSFTSRPSGAGAPPAPPTPPTGSGGGTGPTGPTGPAGPAGPAGPMGPKGPAAEPEVSQTQDTQSGKQTQTAPAGASINFAKQIGGDDNSVDSSVGKGASGGGQISGGDSVRGDQNKGNVHNQRINAGFGPVTATTSGKATSSGKGGVTASTTGTASSHPRAQNASRGSRPTSRKK